MDACAETEESGAQEVVPTNRQVVIEKVRAVNDMLSEPQLQQLAKAHEITIREFASIFGVSKGHAEKILKHRCFPALEVAIRIARYFEVSVEELWGWQLDDDGARRPLIAVVGSKRVRLTRRGSVQTGDLVTQVAAHMRQGGDYV